LRNGKFRGRFLCSRKSKKEQIGKDQLSGFYDWLYEQDLPTAHLLIFELLYGSGLRVSELTGLTYSDLDIGNGFIKVLGKGLKERWVPITEKAKNLFMELRNGRKICVHRSKGEQDAKTVRLQTAGPDLTEIPRKYHRHAA